LGVQGIDEAGFEVIRRSSVYETEPFETFAQPPYLNMIAEVRSRAPLNPEDVMARLLQVETSLGRSRQISKGPRTIDLDLLLYGAETSDTNSLQLPHPQLHRRRFVLVPLAELAPSLVHPTLNQTVSELLAGLNDESEVKLWKP
jgi:2-amino-4-hydroxy-6-hydroxymethyldihydropteridine diphosphokinase